ncbi:ABC transporter ATP-binding protein [Tropicimonas isoalkanivorans]|uniref:Spermidine/putrescine transport system ATP-binding protein n=1 Tax=Tropicimonas isoalkanivorans TaxID=441112 RepID=A0A1I1HJ95_9RHOB|nr:ABC transporter ATP-binding protein [Tropicimonas isoalkanivorans]SFC22028.1 spermidine/putrescine transport system ATP-binding protein [Tropicimonas isoalkanivorans]
MTDPSPLVRFSGVRKSYGTFEAVKGIDLEIGRGEFVAIMGPSGCGKTTTLRMLAGLEAPTDGVITIDGKVMNDVPAHERDTPMVWQSLALFPFLNVAENVEFGLKMRGVAGDERNTRVSLWLDRLGLRGFETRPVDQLSGGQRQRVALARSLVTEPQMLLLDEPLSALDAHLVIRMQGVLSRLQKELGITFVYVTHSQSEAFAMADRVVIMGHGEIAQIGRPQEIFRNPKTRFVAEFVGRNNILSGTVSGGEIDIDGMRFPMPDTPDGPAEIVVAADRMQVSGTPPEAPAVPAEFVSEEFAGTGIICYFEGPAGEELKAQVTEDALAALEPEPGRRFWLNWAPDAAHVMTQ